MEAISVFVSVGRQFTQSHRLLLDRIFCELSSCGVKPEVVPRPYLDNEKPLESVLSVMRRCSGVLVVAYPRIRYQAGEEFPESPAAMTIAERELPTVWLQIEATAAFALDLPTLILMDDQLHPEGVLSPAHGEYGAVYFSMKHTLRVLPSEVQKALEGFCTRVRHRTQAETP